MLDQQYCSLFPYCHVVCFRYCYFELQSVLLQFSKVYLGYKKTNPCKKFAIKVMKKAEMINKNMVTQGKFLMQTLLPRLDNEFMVDFSFEMILVFDLVYVQHVSYQRT